MVHHPRTLFHLVPNDKLTHGVLELLDNKTFVSDCPSEPGNKGLEVGFHVPNGATGHIITRLGRKADLILPELSDGINRHPLKAVHVCFEMNDESKFVMLSVKDHDPYSVTVSRENGQGKTRPGSSVLLYGQRYTINIASYDFSLIWVNKTSEELRSLAVTERNNSREDTSRLRPCDQPTPRVGLDLVRNRKLRIREAEMPLVEIAELLTSIHLGPFGYVHEAVDRSTGQLFIVKTIALDQHPKELRSLLKSSLKSQINDLSRSDHDNIIAYLGDEGISTNQLRLFMPRCEGTLAHLAAQLDIEKCEKMCKTMMHQMLQALDYMAKEQWCHCNVRPENILYTSRDGSHEFRLAGFCTIEACHAAQLVSEPSKFSPYIPPELWSSQGTDRLAALTSTKRDIWPLFATMVAIHPSTKFVMNRAKSFASLANVTMVGANMWPKLGPMAVPDPHLRATAAQMLVQVFRSQGLVTAPDEVGHMLLNQKEASVNIQKWQRTYEQRTEASFASVDLEIADPDVEMADADVEMANASAHSAQTNEMGVTAATTLHRPAKKRAGGEQINQNREGWQGGKRRRITRSNRSRHNSLQGKRVNGRLQLLAGL